MLLIEKAGLEQLPVIQKLAYDIWPASYSDILSAAQIKYMLELLYNEDALRRQMEEDHQFYIAKDGAEAIGFVAFSMIEKGVYKLHKIYLTPQKQGSGFGKILLQFVIDEAKKAGAKTLLLNVNRNNKALYFYKKMGFTILEETDIDIGGGYWMNDYIMQLPL